MRFGVRVFAQVCALILPVFLAAGIAEAQTSVMAPGAAAVTGFSGVPENQSDQPIDLDGPSLRIIQLPTGGDFGLVDAQKRYTATASDIGQVFGVTLDNQQIPNIYAAATSNYGLAIFTPDGRTRRGAPGADYVAGQFGPADQGGGPNSIWRIDGKTGRVALFANVDNPTPASLGGIAFDAKTQQIFAADRATGLIHRFSMDGADQGTYDHGEEGRQAANLDPVAFDPAGVAKIEDRNFDSQEPGTWGFAPEERRVFALAMHNGRLYYSVADGPSIWSVSIANDGSFGDDPRFEATVPSLRRGIEVTAITFDTRGWMYTAERGATTGDPDFMQVAEDGRSRVQRFQPQQPTDDDPSFWTVPGDEYAIGTPPDYRNADGGTALYCNKNIWSTGERLLDDPNASPDDYPHVDGLQGNDISLVKPANSPPTQAWFVSYYDGQADPQSRGHVGQIAIWNVCGGGAVYPPPPMRIGQWCPSGTIWFRGDCVLPPSCPPGTLFRNGYCLYPGCPWGYWRDRGACRRPPTVCRWGNYWYNGRCVPIGCPRDLRYGRGGYCGCPPGLTYRDGKCVRRPPCDPWLYRYTNGTCRRCPDGSIPRDGKCLRRPPCDPVIMRLTNGTCKRCPDGSIPRQGTCPRRPPCDAWLLRATNGTCKRCPDGQMPRDGQCIHRPPCNIIGITAVGCQKPCHGDNCIRRKPPCDTPGVAGCKPRCTGRDCGHVNNCPNGRCGKGRTIIDRFNTPSHGCKGRHCGTTGTSNTGHNNPTGCRGRHCGQTGGTHNNGLDNFYNKGRNNGGCTGRHCGGSSGSNNSGNNNGNNGCRGRHCGGTGGSNNVGNNNSNNNNGCRGRHCGGNGGSTNNFGNNNNNNGCQGRHCGGANGNGFGNRGGFNNGSGNNGGGNNNACPQGEHRHQGRCVPDNGNQGNGNGNGNGGGRRRGRGSF